MMAQQIDIMIGSGRVEDVVRLVERILVVRFEAFTNDFDNYHAAVVSGCRVTVGDHNFEDDGDLLFSRYPIHVQVRSLDGDPMPTGRLIVDSLRRDNIPTLFLEDLQVRLDEHAA